MPIIQTLRNRYQDINTVKTITGAFGEISAGTIQLLKSAFQQNALYFEEISQLYHSIKLSAKVRAISNQPGRLLTYPKTLHVAISSNHHFYGSLNIDLIKRFEELTSKTYGARLIIGQTGREYIGSLDVAKPYEVEIFQHDRPTTTEMRYFLKKYISYERIIVYYPKFINMLSQKIDHIDITHTPEASISPRREIKYIYEPELPAIMTFFEDQVRYILFSRVMLETELSRTAARLVAMNTAQERADTLLAETSTLLRGARRSVINSELIEIFGKIRLRKKTNNN